MMNIVKSELLKRKRNHRWMLCLIVPFFSNFIAYLLVGPQLLEAFTIYWWEACFLYILLGLLIVNDWRVEEQAGHFQNISDTKYRFSIITSKILLTIQEMVIASFVLIIILWGMSFLYPTLMAINIFLDCLTACLMLLASIWLFPFFYICLNYFNSYLLLVGNALFCLLVAPFLAQTPIWFLVPYTYHYKIGQAILHLKPSGDVDLGIIGIDSFQIFISLFLSIYVTGLLLMVLKKGKKYV